MATRIAARRPNAPSRVVAIDIGTDSVHAVEVQFAPDARIVKRGSVSLSRPAWEDLAGNKDALAAAIKGALAAGGITGNQVTTAIPRRMVTLKYARLPHAEPEQIRSMVEFEAQQYVPFPLEEVVLGHQIVSEENEEMTTVMIVAARLLLVEALLAIFDKAGLEVTHISVSALALAEHARGAALPVALLETDGPELDLAVVNADKLLFSRAASLDGARAVSGGPVEQLSAEIARSLAAYQNEHRSAPVSRVLIAGRASELGDVQQALDGLLDIPVGPLVSPLLPAGDPASAVYAVSAGLALQAGGEGISTIDLVPPSRLERKVAARKRTNSLAALVGVAAVLALAGFYVSNMVKAQAAEKRESETWNNRLDHAKTALTRVTGDYDRVKRNYEVASGGMGRAKPMVDVVKAVSDSLPKSGGIYLTQLSFERGTVLTIHGNAANEIAATDLVIALQGSGAFKEVRLNYMGDSSADIGSTPGTARTTTTAGPASSARPGSASGRTASSGTTPSSGTAPASGTTASGTAASVAGTPSVAGSKPAAGAATKSGSAMSFLVTCRVLGADQKEIGDKPIKKATSNNTLTADGRTP